MTITDLCTICQHSLEGPESKFSLDCGHTGHKDCFQRMINRIYRESGKAVEVMLNNRDGYSYSPTIFLPKRSVNT